ncbi:SapC family protein [Aliikangiella sp. IMCC44359]|uniref:SapC family protein n=1 Tax=Aliikangiella sp. IMCC44359 TaxID=3459125 RepID=UPI00403B2EDB
MTNTSIVQLNKQLHVNVKIKQGIDISAIKTHNMLPVIVHEMAQLSTELPIVFVKNSQTGQFNSVVLLGLQEAQNLLIKQSQWQGHFIPSILSNLPLNVVATNQEKDQFTIVIDEKSDLLSNSEGNALFDADGNQTEYLDKRIEALKSYYECVHVTQDFIQTLNQLELLELQSLSFSIDGNKKNIGGIYLVNEKKLNELSNENFSLLRQKGFLGIIYHHLASIHNMSKLIKLTNELSS